LIEQLGGKSSTQSCTEANFAAVPNFNSDSCAFATQPDLHDCTKVPGPQVAKKQRLCYCQPSEKKSTIAEATESTTATPNEDNSSSEPTTDTKDTAGNQLIPDLELSNCYTKHHFEYNGCAQGNFNKIKDHFKKLQKALLQN